MSNTPTTMTESTEAGTLPGARFGFRRYNSRYILRFGLPLATVVMVAYFAAISSDFRSAQNIQDVFRQMAALAIVAAGEGFVIIAGGLDLSVGSTIGLTSVVAALAILKFGMVPGMALGLLAAAGVGVANGLLVTRTGVSSFIVTLGMLSVVQGLALTLAGGSAVYDLPSSISNIGFGSLGPVPYPILIAGVVMVLCYLTLKLTRFGRHVYATGGNAEAARLSGVPVLADQFAVFVISGVLAGVAGLVLTSRVSSGQPELGSGMELNAVAAVILGGVSLYGGQGSMVGILFGVLFISFLSNGLIIMGVSSYTQLMVIGAAVVIAVALDRLLIERSKRA
jgi:ribose transport system permease protein